MTHILTVDVGTMSIRAILYAIDGTLVHETAYEYSARYQPPGLVEQDPADWRDGLFTVLTGASAYVAEHALTVAAITVTSQRASVIPVDSSGLPLHPAVTWQDKRSAAQARLLVDELSMEDIYRRTGLRANPYFSAPKMMWFMHEQPDLYRRAAKLIGVQDYVIYLLTGLFVTDWTQAARTMLLDIRTFQWDDELFQATGIAPSKLPDLVPPGSVAGPLLREVAQRVRLPAALPVIIGGGDQQCAALALNVISAGHAEANTGTGSFAIAHADNPVLHPRCRVLCSASAMPGKWISEAGIFNTGAIYRWCRDEFSGGTAPTYHDLNVAAAATPLGANGVVMLPHFEGSAAPSWNVNAKGIFFNLSIGTTHGDLCRAIIEGIALEITENLRLMEELTGHLRQLSVAGGMARSDLFNQVQADALGRPVVRYRNAEASSLGAVISAMVTLGMADSYQAAFAAVVPEREMVYIPDPRAHAVYDQVGRRRSALYRALESQGVYEAFAASI